MVSSIHCSTLSDQATELLRTYLELGAYRIPYLWPWSPDTGTGEYAFDFAVVIFGVLLLVICQTVVLTPLVALRVLRTQAVNSPSLLYHFSAFRTALQGHGHHFRSCISSDFSGPIYALYTQ